MKSQLLIALSLGLIYNSAVPSTSSQKKIEIFAPLAMGEFFDKLTILMIKREKILDNEKRINVEKEYSLLKDIYEKKIASSAQLDKLIDELLHVNRELWNLEDLTREKEHIKSFDNEFKQFVKSILENNDRRFKIKRAINLLLGSSLVEEKSYKKTLAHEQKYDVSILKSDEPPQNSLISVPISLADLLDRISILTLKLENIREPKKRANVLHEYEILTKLLRENIEECTALKQYYNELLSANSRMWDIQNAMRNKALDEDYDEAFIELGRETYFTNDERIRIKKLINTLFNSALVEEKLYMHYQST